MIFQSIELCFWDFVNDKKLCQTVFFFAVVFQIAGDTCFLMVRWYFVLFLLLVYKTCIDDVFVNSCCSPPVDQNGGLVFEINPLGSIIDLK